MPSEVPNLIRAAEAIRSFTGAELTPRIVSLESRFGGATGVSARQLLEESGVSHDLLSSAHSLKRVAGQINVAIHTIGILLCLPHILEKEECVESLSLGAGNTGRAFDLETNLRVAEFKFIHWQGGSETIRQNALFKDFFQIAEHPTKKAKYMFVLGTEHPLKFLEGGRSLSSVMSRNRALWENFQATYDGRFKKVREYYATRRDAVRLVDIRPYVPELHILTPEDATE